MHEIDLSVIIPTYNRLWCVPAAIESCRNAKCRVEIIVIDDGSTDGTAAWLIKQIGISLIIQPNLGKCWAVNEGFKIAKGKYIRFLDADDMLENDANDEQFELAEIWGADIVVSGYKNFNNKGEVTGKRHWIQTDDFIAQQLGECDSSHYSAYIFKKAFIADVPHRPDYAFRDDRLFVLEAALKEPVIAIHRGAALLHRIDHHDRLQNSSGLKQQVQNFQHLNLYKYILNNLKITNRLTQRRKDAACKILWPLVHWIAIDFLDDAVQMVSWIYQINPDFDIPEKGNLGRLYRKLGFKKTERLLSARRSIVNVFR